jgi:hypothetical protein
MKTNSVVNSALEMASKFRSGNAPAAAAAWAPIVSLLPKLLPLVARGVRRHPLQAALAGAGLLLLATSQRRRRRYSPYL